MSFNPAKKVSLWNYAVEIQYAEGTNPLIRSAFFGTAKDAAAFLDGFDYTNGDVFEWSGDSATLEAIQSYRKGDDVRAIPEFITEYDVNNKTDSGKAIGADEFNRLFRMYFRRDGFTVRRWAVPGGHVYAVVCNGELSGMMWHVPEGADSIIM
ncbi:hypothetical protein SEA_KENREY_265 [Streptomyces phage Kenrey]|nr:hypothetical protein SEA_KENREY_265 [Streptomyces phage Kenrey]